MQWDTALSLLTLRRLSSDIHTINLCYNCWRVDNKVEKPATVVRLSAIQNFSCDAREKKITVFSSTCCVNHIWESPGNYPVFTVVMVIYHYVERIWRILVTPNFPYNINDHEKYYPGEPVNIPIQLLINIIQENNWVITTKNG